MQHVRSLKFAVAAFIAGMGALSAGSAAADDVNMWDGQWHADATAYAWVPFIYPTVQLPPAAGGGTNTSEIQPSQYLKHIKGGVLFDGSVRKGRLVGLDRSGVPRLAGESLAYEGDRPARRPPLPAGDIQL